MIDGWEAARVLRRVAKGYELQAEALREQEKTDAEIKAADQLAIAVALTEVANALDERAA